MKKEEGMRSRTWGINPRRKLKALPKSKARDIQEDNTSRENRSPQETLLSENNQARLPDVSGLVGKQTKRLCEDMGKHSNIF